MKCFYHAMHYSAMHGLGITCRLSICPSVTLVDCDHTGWNSSKIISRLVSVGRSLSADPNIHGTTPRGATGNLGPKWPTPVDSSIADIRSQIVAEWLQIAQRSQWRAYRKPPLLFRMVPSLTPYDLPFRQNGVPYAPMICEWPYLRNKWSDTLHVMFGSRVGFSGSADRMALFWVISNPRCLLENFEWPYLCKGSCYPLRVKILL